VRVADTAEVPRIEEEFPAVVASIVDAAAVVAEVGEEEAAEAAEAVAVVPVASAVHKEFRNPSCLRQK